MYGWQGKILKVDLSRERIETVPLTEELRTNFIGGRGINAKILFDELKRGTGGFDPDNVLIFGSGPLSGTLAPGAGRFNVSGKSPLGFLGDSNCGGHWAPELKFSGFDHVLIRGKAKKPVYLLIRDGEAKLVDARHLWGLDTWRTQRSIRKELRDPGVEVVCIGQAGENLVRFACV
ncbi:aldehyde ferredoxin oxidoreductase, partial [Candidatus Aerophobetes bacterium]